MEKVKEIAWHYTTGKSYEAIKASGMLEPIHYEDMGKNEKPVIWFSSHPHYDPGAAGFFQEFGKQIRRLSLEEMLERHKVLVRVGVPSSSLIPWRAGRLATAAKLSKQERRAKEMVAVSHGANPQKYWYGSLEAIRLDTCRVERLKEATGQWELSEPLGGKR